MTLQETQRQLFERTIQVFEGYVQEYNAQAIGVPDRLRLKAQAILSTATVEEAQALAARLQIRGRDAYLAAWAAKKIPGKITEVNAEAKAKKAESLAAYLEKQGDIDAAEKQRERAAKIRAMVEE